MKKALLLLTALFSLFFFSCQKEIESGNNSNTGGSGGSSTGNTGGSNTGSNAGDINGTWKFINFHAKTNVANEVSAAGVTMRTVTLSDYTTENNTGTITFTDQNMSYDNLSYSINTRARATMYQDGVLVDTFSMPMLATIPPTKGQANITKVGSDSLTFQNGSFMMNGVSQTANSGGAKLRRDGDKLYMTQRVNQTENTIVQGQTAKSTQQAEVVITLQKQ